MKVHSASYVTFYCGNLPEANITCLSDYVDLINFSSIMLNKQTLRNTATGSSTVLNQKCDLTCPVT
jgi:hypothetical protein